MTKLPVVLLSLVGLIASMLMGVLGSAGLCARLWGSSILDTALGDPPEISHPAFITFMLVMIPGTLLGAVGAIAGIILPLYARFGIRCTGTFGVANFMRNHVRRILKVTGDL